MATFLGTLFIVICILLIIVVLLQKGRGGGLGSAFGGSSSSAFGTRTGDVFTWVTIVLTALFLLTAIGSSLAFRPPMATVETPAFVPAPGPIAGPIDLRMVSKTGGATLRYTLDGSMPTKNSEKYPDVPITIKPGTTVKAMATATGMKPSGVAVGEYPLASPETQPTSRPASAPAEAAPLDAVR